MPDREYLKYLSDEDKAFYARQKFLGAICVAGHLIAFLIGVLSYALFPQWVGLVGAVALWLLCSAAWQIAWTG